MPNTALALPSSASEPDQINPLPGGERLAAVLAAAAPFGDRVSEEFFDAVPGAGRELRDRVRRFVDQAVPGRRGGRALCARRATNDRELRAGLRVVRLRDPRRLPEWARALVAFLEAQPDGDDPASALPGAIFTALARAGEALLDRDPGLLAGTEVTSQAREQLVSTFGVRVWYTLKPAIEFELRLLGIQNERAEVAALDVSLEGWLERMERLPGIAYVVGLSCQQWRRALGEIFSRLRRDRELLRQELWGGADPGALSAFTGDAGDRHNGGRAVALLEFASGAGVVYKPKDLRQTSAFMELVEFLNGRGLPLELASRKILVRDGYGWEERVAAGPCADRGGFARYYRRLGMLARLAQLLEGRDLWADNLLACGEQPALTDLECLLYPKVTPPPAVESKHELLDLLDETVVRTGMIFQPWVPRDELDERDLGCLSRAGDVVPGRPQLPLPPYRPWCGEVLADPWAYGREVIAGYRDMQAALAASRDALRAAGGPLETFKGLEVRYIWRHTWDCQRIVRVSTGPRALRDGAEREIVLAKVLRDAYTTLDRDPDRIDLVEIAEAEVEAFRQLDVPLFLSLTDSEEPRTPDGRVLGPHFRGTAWRRLQARVDGLAEFDLDEQVAVITACLEAARAGTELTARPARPNRLGMLAVPRLTDADELTETAGEIAQALIDARGGRGGWLALSWYPVPDLYQVEVAGSDLLTGTSAFAVFLSELAVRTGHPRHRKAARDALDDILGLVGDSFAYTMNLRLAGGSPVPGGFAGPGAAMYALARCGVQLGDPALLAAARTFIAPARATARSPRVCADLPFGTAGLLMNALACRSPELGSELDELIAELAARSLRALAGGGDEGALRLPPYARSSRLNEVAPVGPDGIAAALARALASAPELLPDPGAVRDALAAHHCEVGVRGGRMAALTIAAALGRAPEAGARIELSPGASLGCRELVATTRELLLAGERPAAARLFGELARRRGRTGRWFSDRWIEDRVNLSAVDGLVAVGLLALELTDPSIQPLMLLG